MLEQLAETVRTHRPTRSNQAFPDWLRTEVVAAARPMLDKALVLPGSYRMFSVDCATVETGPGSTFRVPVVPVAR